jgi:hypothetical protein
MLLDMRHSYAPSLELDQEILDTPLQPRSCAAVTEPEPIIPFIFSSGPPEGYTRKKDTDNLYKV